MSPDSNDNQQPLVLDDYCIDMLKEVGHICTGNAAMALSQLIGKKISLTIPDLKLIERGKLSGVLTMTEDMLVGISIHLLGALTGNVVMMFPEKSAYSIVDVVAQQNCGSGNATEYGVSSLKEIGNIVISAYLTALSSFTKTVIMFSTPNLICGVLDTVFNAAFPTTQSDREQVILIETFFSIPEQNIEGSFFLVFDPVAVQKIISNSPSRQ